MAQQPLDQVLELFGYQVTNRERDEKQVFLYARPQPHRVCCSTCGSGQVICPRRVDANDSQAPD
jgi:hypothetical protein